MRERAFIVILTVLGIVGGTLRAQLPSITNQPISRAVWTGCNVTFLVGVSGAGPFTYQWQFNGTNISNNIISTVAGNSTQVQYGDGGAATNAGLSSLLAVSLDSAGNLYLPDDSQQRVRKVDTSGIIRTIAGGGTNGLGDGGLATNASLHNPGAVAVDALGNVFIPDLANERIRKVDQQGIISTVAGTGTGGYSGDGGPATNAALNNPSGVTIDASGNLFIADQSNRRIRKMDTNGIISTVAGNGTFGYTGEGGPATNASMYGPYRVAVDRPGNVFFVDSLRIRKVDTNGILMTVAGNGANGYSGDGGTATNASLNGPRGVAVDGYGNLFIADSGNGRIREVNTDGIITTVAGGGPVPGDAGPPDGVPATNAWLFFPYGVAIDVAGNRFIADTDDGRVRKVTNTQGPVLALNEVTTANAGNYQVVVTGPGGRVTSRSATLTVATSPLVYALVPHADGSVTLDFASVPDSTNVVLCATNLLPPIVWQSLSTNVAGADGDWQYADTNIAGLSARFYRSAATAGP